MLFATLASYNEYLSVNPIKMTLDEYFKNVHIMFYSNADISCMGAFLSYYSKFDELMINHTHLLMYNALIRTNNTSIVNHNELDLTLSELELCLVCKTATRDYLKYFITISSSHNKYTRDERFYLMELLERRNHTIDLIIERCNE